MNIVAIIPAFNEGANIDKVLAVLTKVKDLDKIIVVSDGSTDNTVEVAKSFGVEVIALEQNQGKGCAMRVGVERGIADIILFLDADLIGLTKKHILALLAPVMKGEVDMTVGVFEDGRVVTDLAQKLIPKLSGQRAVKSSVLRNLSDFDVAKFGVEVVLNNYIKEDKISWKKVILHEMSHLTKEEKLGLFKGMNARMKMYWEIVSYIMKKH